MTCALCDRSALYQADGRGFCREHRATAVNVTRELARRQESKMAVYNFRGPKVGSTKRSGMLCSKGGYGRRTRCS